MHETAILGAGVIGLTTALTLREAGIPVRVIAAATGARTTSAAAGAVWFPYKADPPQRVLRWAAVTRAWLARVAREFPGAGVDVIEVIVCADTDETPWWSGAAGEVRRCRGRFENIAPVAWRFDAPRIVPLAFLRWLEGALDRPVEIRRVGSLDEIDSPRIINCTGLGAAALVGDAELTPVFGQTVIVEPGAINLAESIEDDREPPLSSAPNPARFGHAVFYSIPRRSEVVLGGVAIPCDASRPATPDPAIRDAILARCARYGLKPGRVLRESAGLRPCRTTVRLERDANDARVVHNYGHGGAGFTLCRGCAAEVLAGGGLPARPILRRPPRFLS